MGIKPGTSYSADFLYYYPIKPQLLRCSGWYLIYVTQERAFIRRIKKPVLNPTLTLTLVLRAKHNDVFHCLYEGKFLVSLRRASVGASEAGPTLDHLKLTKNLPSYN